MESLASSVMTLQAKEVCDRHVFEASTMDQIALLKRCALVSNVFAGIVANWISVLLQLIGLVDVFIFILNQTK